MSVAKAPERLSRRSFLAANAGSKSGLGFIGASARRKHLASGLA
jgi:hypothetical protein